MALTVAITCDATLHWMDYRIEADEVTLAWQTDSFTDSFRDFLTAVVDALAGQTGYVEFTDVPLAKRLLLEPSGDRLALTILEFHDWPILQSVIGEPGGALDVRLRTFAGAVLSAGKRLAEDRQDYVRAARHQFPDDRLEELALALKKGSSGAQQKSHRS